MPSFARSPFKGVASCGNDCLCCGRPLEPRKCVWLELDQRTNTYHDFGGVPEDRSQGFFPFGLTCARKMRAAARKATGAA